MRHKISWLLSVCLVLCSFYSNAQQADFSVSDSAGCSPLVVTFTNTSTGFSPSATVQFNFGEGGGNIQFPAAPHTYIKEQTYTATLTVTDNGSTYTATKLITVYKKPTVDFSSDFAKICANNTVTYTSSSMPGDGVITSYLWDFGDGSPFDSTGSEVKHTYGYTHMVAPSLIVTNSYGCFNSVTKPNIVTILKAPKVAFTPSETSVCNAADAVAFTNATTGGAPPTTYLWSFGDGATSTDVNPAHSYGIKGNFGVRLLATSSEGCSDTSKTSLITVASSQSGITLPTLLCLNGNLIFTDSSSPLTNHPVWLLDDNVVATDVHQYTTVFTDTKIHKLQLVNVYGSCSDTATKMVQALAAPQPTPFNVNIQGFCAVPATANFADAGVGAVKWEWDMNNKSDADTAFHPSAFTKSATNIYTTENTYYVKLRVTDASGCTGSIREPIVIKKNTTTLTSTQGVYGCHTLSTTFKASSLNPIAEYNWSFSDDNSTSIVDTPQHIFVKEGNYKVFLQLKTTGGCNDTASIKVHIGDEPDFDFQLFSPADTLVCGNKLVNFKVTGDSNKVVGQYYWKFGDAANYTLLTGPTYSHQYLTDSAYTVSLAINNHGCNDTITKVKFLTVLPPFPKISSSVNNCDDRSKVALKETSKKAQTYSWNFGDGSPVYNYDSTARDTAIVHYFPNKTTSYKVVLTTTYNGCSVRDSIYSRILINQKPLLTAMNSTFCINDSLQTTVSNMDLNPYGYNYKYAIKTIQYASNSPFTGTYLLTTKTNYSVPFNVNVNKLNTGKDSVRFITSSYYFNCPDTTNYVPIQINGPKAGFSVGNSFACLSDKTNFTDTSKANPLTPITTWKWFYGDGIIDTLTTQGSTSHHYNDPGNYKVKLVVSDQQNCSDTAYYSGNSLTIKGPKARFAVAQNPILPNTSELFTNLTDSGYSGRINNSYDWSFGDGNTTTSNDDKISHSYKIYSDDTVVLVAKSSETGCSDTTSSIVHVKNTNLSFIYASKFLNPNTTCPPVLVNFTNTSVNFDVVSWDFGDGLTADNINTPTHTYYKPGVYKVTIFGYYSDNTYDSSWDYVTVIGPTATLHADVLPGCGSKQVVFTAQTQNSTSLVWDFGDGTASSDSIVSHLYTTPNVYTPSLTVKNGSQCVFSYSLDTPVVIDSLNVSIHKDSLIQCHQLLVNFTPKVFSTAKDNGEVLNYSWSFGMGGDSTKTDSASFTYKQPGTYQVSLIVASPYGCTDTATTQVTYTDAPVVTIKGASEFCENTPVSFSAVKTNSTDVLTYNWQFQNGATSTQQTPPPQTFSASGGNTIKLMVDKNGCTDTLVQALTIHAQPNVKILASDSIVCLGSSVSFTAQPVTNTQDTISYVWNFGTGKDSAAGQSASFAYANYDTYAVSLKATSTYGCQEELKDTVEVSPSPMASIKAPTDICIGTTATYNGTSSVASAKYLWHFGDNTTSADQNPAAKTYNTSGTDNSYLVVSIGGCRDTAYHALLIHDYPQVDLFAASSKLCLGDSVQLVAHNGQMYQWLAATDITNTNIADPYVFPASDTKYVVLVTDSYGCKNQDSITISVVKPQHITVTSPVNVCFGGRATLAAAGTDKYNWINGVDLTDASIATPATKDSAHNKIYTVVGSDADGCFEDTAQVTVVVKDNPVVDAGNNVTVPAGTSVQLSATASGNVTKWNWQPPLYLSCADCPAPISKPRQSTVYTAEATDNFGCKGSDTVRVEVICKESLVSVPEIFTPNNDGNNDRFRITASGVKIITHFVIYGRNGSKVFERNNVSPLDNNASWDGMCNNAYMPTGTYVYIIQAVCDAGQVYNLQGTVTLMR